MTQDAAPPGPAPKKILIIDDERIVADTLATILRQAGYDSWAMYSAEAALAVAHWTPDLAIVDVNLPGINGLDLAVHLRRLCADCQVLILSGHTSTEDLLQQLRLEGHRFEAFPKPIPPQRLLDIVAQRLATPNPAPAATGGPGS